MKIKYINVLVTVFCVLLSAQVSNAQRINLFGDWSTLVIDETNINDGPFQSAPDVIEMSIGNFGRRDNWEVHVRRADINWPADFDLEVRRTGDGKGPGRVTGGDAYQMIYTTDASFLSGSHNLNKIPLQLRLSGVSLQVPPGTYTTEIVFTLIGPL